MNSCGSGGCRLLRWHQQSAQQSRVELIVGHAHSLSEAEMSGRRACRLKPKALASSCRLQCGGIVLAHGSRGHVQSFRDPTSSIVRNACRTSSWDIGLPSHGTPENASPKDNSGSCPVRIRNGIRFALSLSASATQGPSLSSMSRMAASGGWPVREAIAASQVLNGPDTLKPASDKSSTSI